MTKKEKKYYERWSDSKSAWLQPYDQDPCNYGKLTWDEGIESVIEYYKCEIETIYKDITEDNYPQYWKQEVCVCE